MRGCGSRGSSPGTTTSTSTAASNSSRLVLVLTATTSRSSPHDETPTHELELVTTIQTVDHAKATLDGRNLVFGLTAKLLGGVLRAGGGADLADPDPDP